MVYHSTVSIHHLECKMFLIIEWSGFDSTRCASSTFSVFSVLCVLWLHNAAQKFYGDVDMWSVCGVESFGVRSCMPFCNLMHSTVWWCIWGLQLSSNPKNTLHLYVVAQRCITCRVSDELPKHRNVDLSCSRQGRFLQHCLVVSQRASLV